MIWATASCDCFKRNVQRVNGSYTRSCRQERSAHHHQLRRRRSREEHSPRKEVTTVLPGHIINEPDMKAANKVSTTAPSKMSTCQQLKEDILSRLSLVNPTVSFRYSTSLSLPPAILLIKRPAHLERLINPGPIASKLYGEPVRK